MTRILTALPLLIALAIPVSVSAQTTPSASPRVVYNEARAKMDQLIMERRMGDALRMFEGLAVPDNKELAAIDTKMRVLYKQDFENVALVRSEVHKNGFRQEMIAYWTDNQYLFVYLLIHTDQNAPKLINFQFDSDFHAINRLF